MSRAVRIAVQSLAAEQDGVLSRTQAQSLGADRWLVRREVEAGRWRAIGLQSVACHRLELSTRARWRITMWEAGEHAALDGATALEAAGLANFTDRIHVIVPWPYGARSFDGAVVHNSRLWTPEDFIEKDGLRYTRPDVAAIRAAMYARSNRAAATVMAMTVQQRLTTGELVLLQARRLNRHKRRPLILEVARDIAEGAEALSELDFAKLCRMRGLPPPSRQVVRRGRNGRVYLDVYWDDFRLAIEIEGIHHDAPENVIDDSLRQNDLTIGRDVVLRIPVLGLRTCPDAFMDQVEQMLNGCGWRRAA